MNHSQPGRSSSRKSRHNDDVPYLQWDIEHNSHSKTKSSSRRRGDSSPDFEKISPEKSPERSTSPRELKIISKTIKNDEMETGKLKKTPKSPKTQRDEPEPEILEQKKVISAPSSPKVKKKIQRNNETGNLECPQSLSNSFSPPKKLSDMEIKSIPEEIDSHHNKYQGIEIQCFTCPMIFPPKQFIENIVFVLVDKEIRQRCKSWNHQIKEMIYFFKVPPNIKETTPTWESIQGWLRISKDGGFNFVEKFVTILGDNLFICNDSEEFDYLQKKPIQFVYSFPYLSSLLLPDAGSKSFPIYHVIRLITQEGKTYDLLCEDEHKAKLWSSKLDKIWDVEFLQGTTNLKKNIEDFVSLIQTGFDLSLILYEQLARYCVECKWVQKNYLERQGSLKMIDGNNTIEVFATLYTFFITLQDELLTEESTSSHKIIDLIQLKFAILLKDDDDDKAITFKILTPKRQYTFQARHNQAKLDWCSRISRGIAYCQGVSQVDKKEIHEAIETTYFYSSSLIGRMSIRFSGEKSGITLRKNGPWLIGRSHTNHIVIEEDDRISRTHCKIQLINNVPFLFDLGSSTSTFLEGERIREAPLKPGNNIRIGRTVLIFDVKDGDSIFFDRKEGKGLILLDTEEPDKYNEEKCTIS